MVRVRVRWKKAAGLSEGHQPSMACMNTLRGGVNLKTRGAAGGLAPPVLLDMADRPVKQLADII